MSPVSILSCSIHIHRNTEKQQIKGRKTVHRPSKWELVIQRGNKENHKAKLLKLYPAHFATRWTLDGFLRWYLQYRAATHNVFSLLLRFNVNSQPWKQLWTKQSLKVHLVDVLKLLIIFYNLAPVSRMFKFLLYSKQFKDFSSF